MKKIVLSLALAGFAAANLMAQACAPDNVCVSLGVGIYPAPDSMDTGTPNGLMSPLPCAYVGVPYEFTFTAVVPTSYLISGQTLAISRVDLTGINNRPPGINYACNPAGTPAQNGTCSFPSSATVGRCVKLSGTPTAAGLYAMVVKTKIYTSLPIALSQDFPPSTGNPIQNIKGKYVLNVLANSTTPCPSAGFERIGCTAVGTNNRTLRGDLSVKITPNPANEQTFFTVGTKKFTPSARMMVSNAFGQQVYNENITLDGIDNNLIQFDCSTLASGVYFYTIEANGDRISERFVVQHQ